MGSTFVRTAILRYAPRAVGLMEIENIIRYAPCTVGLKPSARQGEARLRGLWRIIYSKTIHLVVAPQHDYLQSYNVVLSAIGYRLSAIASRLTPLASRLPPPASHTRHPRDVAMQRRYAQPSPPAAGTGAAPLRPYAASRLAPHPLAPLASRLLPLASCLPPLASCLTPLASHLTLNHQRR